MGREARKKKKDAVLMAGTPTAAPEQKTLTFSVIMPTWGEFEGLKRSLANVVYQSRPEIFREVIVVGDGFEEGAKQLVELAQETARKEKQNVKIWYLSLSGHSGTGNIPRAIGLERATQEWVCFFDAGTSICHNLFGVLNEAIQEHNDVLITTWDMVQMLDPVPFTSVAKATIECDRSNGLPYVLPGCATAVKREAAQLIPWPNAEASDWVYFSRLWEKLFYADGKEDLEKVDKSVMIIPWTMTVAYGAREKRKWRPPLTMEEYHKLGYHSGYDRVTDKNKVIEVVSGDTIKNT